VKPASTWPIVLLTGWGKFHSSESSCTVKSCRDKEREQERERESKREREKEGERERERRCLLPNAFSKSYQELRNEATSVARWRTCKGNVLRVALPAPMRTPYATPNGGRDVRV